MMLVFDPCQANTGAKGIKSLHVIWPKMREAGSGLVLLAYELCPVFDFLLILPGQADVVAPIEPFLHDSDIL
jgi:hypothetical protein